MQISLWNPVFNSFEYTLNRNAGSYSNSVFWVCTTLFPIEVVPFFFVFIKFCWHEKCPLFIFKCEKQIARQLKSKRQVRKVKLLITSSLETEANLVSSPLQYLFNSYLQLDLYTKFFVTVKQIFHYRYVEKIFQKELR